MNADKLRFLQVTFIEKLKQLDAKSERQWGVMNVQQMIEHMSDSVRIANGKDPQVLLTPAEKMDAMKSFLMSDREFKPNTKNIQMPETALPVRLNDKEEAIAELQLELRDFVNHFTNNPDARVMNPFFGNLNFEEWIQLLHKHAVHHLKQFGSN